jgi:hypothetical protein
VREISPRFPERTANNKEKFFRSQNPFFIIRATPPPPSSREKSCCGLTNSAVKLATKAFSTLDNPSSVKIEFAAVIKVNSHYPRRNSGCRIQNTLSAKCRHVGMGILIAPKWDEHFRRCI